MYGRSRSSPRFSKKTTPKKNQTALLLAKKCSIPQTSQQYTFPRGRYCVNIWRKQNRTAISTTIAINCTARLNWKTSWRRTPGEGILWSISRVIHFTIRDLPDEKEETEKNANAFKRFVNAFEFFLSPLFISGRSHIHTGLVIWVCWANWFSRVR